MIWDRMTHIWIVSRNQLAINNGSARKSKRNPLIKCRISGQYAAYWFGFIALKSNHEKKLIASQIALKNFSTLFVVRASFS